MNAPYYKKFTQNATYLKYAYILAISIIAITLLLGQFVVQSALDNQEDDVKVINISGGQRMLSQKIIKEALLVTTQKTQQSQKELKEIYQLFEDAHLSLTKKQNVLQFSSNYVISDSVALLYQELEPHFQQIKKSVRQITTTKLEDSTTQLTLEQSVNKLLETEKKFLPLMNKIVLRYEQEAQQKLNNLRETEFRIIAFSLLILLLEAIFIFHPLIKQNKKFILESIETNQELSTLNEELTSSEEEIRQNSEELQSANHQLKIIQSEIEEKEVNLRALINNTDDHIYSIDTNYCFITANQNVINLYATAGIKIEKGMSVIDLAPTEELKNQFKEYYDTVLTKGKALKVEQNYTDERIHSLSLFYELLINPIIDNQKQIIGCAVFARDITLDKQREEELQRQTAYQKAILDNAALMIIATDKKGIITSFNPAAEKTLGYTANQLIGKQSPALFHDLNEIIERAEQLTKEFEEEIKIGFEVFVYRTLKGLPNIQEWTYITKNKERIVVNLTVSSIVQNGEIIGFLGIAEDIRERKKTEQLINIQNKKLQLSEKEIRENYEKLQATQELVNNAFSELDAQFIAISTTLGYAEINTDQKVERANKLFANWLGYEVEELKGKSYFQFIYNTPEDRQKYELLWQTLRQGETFTDVFKRQTKEGKEVWFYGAYCPVKNKNGEVVKVIKIASNYNTQKEFETKIKYNNARLQNLIENVGDLVFLLDTNLVFLEYYASSSRDLVLQPNQFLGKKVTEIPFPKKPLQAIVQTLYKTLQEKEKNTLEYKLELSHGNEWFSLSVSPIFNENNDIENLLCVSRTITYIKQTEIAVKEQNIALALQKEQAEKSLFELQLAQNQLIQSEKMASLGQLVANIAHEINTPLGAIRSSAVSIASILEEILPSLPSLLKKLDDTTLQNFNEFVKKSSQKTSKLSSREKRVIKYELIEELENNEIENADDYANWIVDTNMYDEKDLFLSIAKHKNAKEIFHNAYQISTIIRSNQTVKVATDRAAKIVFALKNFTHQDQTGEKTTVNITKSIETTLTLYHNQIKHGIDVTRDFGKVPEFKGYPDELIQVWTNIIHNAIQAMKNKGRLFIQTSVENNNALISIQDTGGGIPQEIQNRIFDAFFTTKPAGEGSGLGLDITKKIIEKHNGKIWFDSLEGKGTTFFIELPLN